MPIPWLVVLDSLIGAANFARSRTPRLPAEDLEVSGGSGRAFGQIEARLAGVVVAALKEAFDRDANRLELERDQLELERVRAERMLKIELLRQAGDREIGRLRLMAFVSIGSWIGTLLLATRLVDGPPGARAMLGAGWLLLLGALSLSFAVQTRIGRALARVDEPLARHDDLAGGTAGAFVLWLIVGGLAVIGLAVLIV